MAAFRELRILGGTRRYKNHIVNEGSGGSREVGGECGSARNHWPMGDGGQCY